MIEPEFVPPTASPWTAVIAAAAALIGVLLGELLQTRREDRNWERQREDQRRRDAEAWAREDRIRFLEIRRQLHSEFLGEAQKVERMLIGAQYKLEKAAASQLPVTKEPKRTVSRARAGRMGQAS